MNEKKLNNQMPILRFLNKHKWRIILPVLFVTFYFALPRYFQDHVAVQQNLFIKSSTLDKHELDREVSGIKDEVLSDEFLNSLISEFDLFENVSADKTNYMRKRTDIWIQGEHYKNETAVSIWIHFNGNNTRNIAAIAEKISARFENNPRLQVHKYVTESYYPVVAPNFQLIADIALQGLFLLSIPLILIWEIPFLFYSSKTKEMVFNPLKSDWQNELLEAKLRNKTWKAAQINIRYSYAFLAAMLQKSPLGDLFEFISKFAK